MHFIKHHKELQIHQQRYRASTKKLCSFNKYCNSPNNMYSLRLLLVSRVCFSKFPRDFSSF